MKFRFKGLKEYADKLERLSNSITANAMVEQAVADGSEIVDKQTYDELLKVKIDNRPYVDGMRDGILQIQKDTLLKAFGTSPIENKRDFINDKTGVDNSKIPYKLTAKQQKERYKKNLYVVTMARRLENGTSYMKKNPVFSRASRKARKPCLEAMQESLDRSYKSLMK